MDTLREHESTTDITLKHSHVAHEPGREAANSLKHLIGRIREDPWNAIEWNHVQQPEVAEALIRFTDDAVFEKRWSDALDYSAIARRVSKKIGDAHLMCQAEACSGTVLRSVDAHKFAEKKLLVAADLCDCRQCRSEVLRRWGINLLHQGKFEDAHQYFNKALRSLEGGEFHNERLRNYQICAAHISRACALRPMGELRSAFEDLQRAADYIDRDMPSRILISAVVNVIWIIGNDCDRAISSRDALDVVEAVRQEILGSRVHSAVRPFIRWCKGILYARLGEIHRAENFLDTAIRGLIQQGAAEDNIKAARADRVLIKSWSRFPSPEDRAIIEQLIEECDGVEGGDSLFSEAKENPSPDNILRWRRTMTSAVPGVSFDERPKDDVEYPAQTGILP